MGGWRRTSRRKSITDALFLPCARRHVPIEDKQMNIYDYNSKKRYLVLQLVLMVTARKQNGLNQSTRSKDEQKLRLGYRLPEREKKT